MPAVTERVINNAFQFTPTTLAASGNPVVYVPNTGQLLIFQNPTGGSLTATIIGDAATSARADGTGGNTTTTSTGFAVVVAAGATGAVYLDDIPAYLVGNIDITGANLMLCALVRV